MSNDREEIMLKGIGASQGYGIGKAVIINDMNTDYSNIEYSMKKMKKQD